MPKATGQITIVDLNDAILSGTAPTNPVVGTLWIDTSTTPNKLFSWSGSVWVPQSLDISALDPEFHEEVETIKTFVLNASGDGYISASEKLNTKLLLVEITGDTLAGDTLPTMTTIDSRPGGQVYLTRAEARAAGVPTTHASYLAFQTGYNDLRVYLNGLSPRPWQPGDTKVVPTTWTAKWTAYYEGLSKLRVTTSEYLANSLKPGASYNGVTIESTNGIVVLRGDSLSRTTLNATEGLKIERYVSGAWDKVLSAGTDGRLEAKGLVIDSTSTLNGTSASTVVTRATAGNTLATDFASDLKITAGEKIQLRREWESIQQEYAQLKPQADGEFINSSSYQNAYNALNGNTPRIDSDILLSMSTTYTFTTANRDAFNSKWKTYFDEADRLRKIISDKISSVAGAADATANNLRDVTVPAIAGRVGTTESNISTINNKLLSTITSTEAATMINESKSNNYGYRYYAKVTVYGERTDLYYPVVIKGGDQTVKRDILIKRAHSEQAPPDWYTSTHKGGLTVKIRTNFGGWGGANYSWEVHELEEMYSKTFGGAVHTGNYTAFAIFLRGGGTTGAVYHIYSDQPLDHPGYNSIGTVPPSPQVAVNEDLIFDYDHSNGNYYKVYAPPGREYNQAVIDEIAARQFIKLSQDNAAQLIQHNTAIEQNATDIQFRATKDDIARKLIPVRYIKISSNGSTENASNHMVELQAVNSMGTNVAAGKTAIISSASTTGSEKITDGVISITSGYYWTFGTGSQWFQLDLGSVNYDITHLNVFYWYGDSRRFKDVHVEVSENGTDWQTLHKGNMPVSSNGYVVTVNEDQAIARINSQISLQAGQITQRVEKTDFTGEKIISMVNQTPDTFKVQAKNIELQGAVTFSSLDPSTQTKVTEGSTAKSTLDSKASVWDAKETPAGAQAKVDSMEIGVRNLLRNSVAPVSSHSSNLAELVKGVSTPFGIRDIYKYTTTSSTTSSSLIRYNNAFTETGQYTFSYYARTVNSGETANVQGDIADMAPTTSDIVTNTWKRYSMTANVTNGSRFVDVAIRTQNVPVYIAFWKLEKGSKTTDWDLAPEDIDGSISEVKTTADSAASTISTNSSVWGRASNINSNGTFNTTKLSGTVTDAQVASSSSWNAAKSSVDDMSNDNKLTSTEKRALKIEYDAITKEKDQLGPLATKYGISITLYNSAYSTLKSYLDQFLGNLATTSSINGATMRANFDAYYSEASRIAALVSSNAKDLADAAQKTANEIEVGGTNLYPNSGNFKNTLGWTNGTVTQKDGYSVLEGTGTIYNPVDIPLSPGTEYVVTAEMMFSFDYSVTNTVPNHIYVRYPGESSSGASESGFELIGPTRVLAANTWNRVSIKFKTKADTTKIPGLRFHVYPGSTTGTRWLKNVKLEKGNKPTDWSPSVDDVTADIAAAVKPSNDQLAAWAHANNKTLIDGGKIFTSSVTADQIKSNTITATNGIIASLDADKITAGTVKAKHIQIGGASSFLDGYDPTKLESINVPDTRSSNQLPSYYWSNYPKKLITEFKFSNTVGLSVGSTYGTMLTKVPWSDRSGGSITQTFECLDGVFTRQSNAADTGWTDWKQSESTDGAAQKAAEATVEALRQSAHTRSKSPDYTLSSFIPNTGYGINMEVTQPTHLGHVAVYSDYAGDMSVVFKETGKADDTKNFTLAVGKNRIYIDKMLYPGSQYSLVKSAGTGNLRRNSSGVAFPYKTGSFTVTGNYAGSSSYYYYFYECEVTEDATSVWQYEDTTYIDGGNIYANTVTANQIKAYSISTNHIATEGLHADVIKAGTIDAQRIRIGSTSTFDSGFDPRFTPLETGKIFKNVASINASSGAPNVAIIRTPMNFGSYMTRIDIKGYVYSGGKETIDLTIGFYAYSDQRYINDGWSSKGKTVVSKVELAKDAANKVVLIITFKDSSLSYPKILVESVQIGHVAPPDSFINGWSITLGDNRTGLTVVKTSSGNDYEEAYSLTKNWQQGNTTYINGGNIYTGSITALQIKAGTISADKLTIGANPNLVVDGYDTLQQLPEGTSAISNQTLNGSANYGITTSVKGMTGNKSLQLVSGGVLLSPNNTTHRINVVAGKSYIASAYAMRTISGDTYSYRIGLKFDNQTNPIYVESAISSHNEFSRIHAQITAPAGATSASLYIYSSATWYWDAFMVEEALPLQTEPSPWKPAGATVIHGGNITSNSVTANQIAGKTITADQIKAGAITATNGIISSLNADDITTGTIKAQHVQIGSNSQFGPGLDVISKNGSYSISLPSAGGGKWYRIASNNGNRAYAKFMLKDTTSGQHGIANIEAGINYGSGGQIILHNYQFYSTRSFTKARIVKASTYDPVYLDVFIENNARTQNLSYYMTDNIQESGWTAENWVEAPALAAGYSVIEQVLSVEDITTKKAEDAKIKTDLWTYPGTTTINGGSIRTNTITATQIASNTITATQIASNTITATQIASNTITATNGIIASIDASKITTNTMHGDRITAGTINADRLKANTVIANNITFTGILSGATGTFSGSLSAATGTFAGSLSAATGTFAGNLQAAGGTFSGTLSAAKGTFSGNLSAAGGTFAGDVSIGSTYTKVFMGTTGGIPSIYSESISTANYSHGVKAGFENGLMYIRHDHEGGTHGVKIYQEQRQTVISGYAGGEWIGFTHDTVGVESLDTKLIKGGSILRLTSDNNIEMYTQGQTITSVADFQFNTVESFRHAIIKAGKGSIKFLNGSIEMIQFRNRADTAYVNIQAANVSVSSDPSYKKNITKFERPLLGELMNLQTYMYNMNEDPENYPKRLGLMSTEVPKELKANDGKAVDIYAESSYVLKATQDLVHLLIKKGLLSPEDVGLEKKKKGSKKTLEKKEPLA